MKRVLRFFSTFLSLSLTLAAPGLAPYQAAAQALSASRAGHLTINFGSGTSSPYGSVAFPSILPAASLQTGLTPSLSASAALAPVLSAPEAVIAPQVQTLGAASPITVENSAVHPGAPSRTLTAVVSADPSSVDFDGADPGFRRAGRGEPIDIGTAEMFLGNIVDSFPQLARSLGVRRLSPELYQYPATVEAANKRLDALAAGPSQAHVRFESALDYARLWSAGKLPYARPGDEEGRNFGWLHLHDFGYHGAGALVWPKKLVDASRGLMSFWLSVLDEPALSANPALHAHASRALTRLAQDVDKASALMTDAFVALNPEHDKILNYRSDWKDAIVMGLLMHNEFYSPQGYSGHRAGKRLLEQARSGQFGALSPAELKALGRLAARASHARVSPVDLKAFAAHAMARAGREGPLDLEPRVLSDFRTRRTRRVTIPELGRRKLAESYKFPADGAVKVAFFDADSTLRVSLSGSVSANGPRDVMLLPWVSAKLAALAREGYLIVIVSNQNGIPRHISLEDSDAALAYAVELIRREGGEVHHYDFAEKRDDNRKPGVGMALRLEQSLKDRFGPTARIDKSRSLMVGDSAYKPGDTRPDGKPGTHFSNSDRLFAEAYGIAFHEPTDFFGWRKYGVDVFLKAAEVEAFLKTHPQPDVSRDSAR